MTEWPSVRIRDIGIVYDGPHATPKTIEEGPLFLGIPSLNAGRLDLSNTRHVSEDDFARWTKRVEPTAGDFVFSYETKIGEAALIPEGLRCCLGRRMGLVRLDRDKCDPRYFLYQYLSPEYQQFLASRTVHGATVDRLLLKDFPDFEFPLPPIQEQRAIAALLCALDDKIELNRRMSATLEEMARALYRSWFVDFDPVHARALGQSPAHMDATTAALFPDSFGPDGLPKGWHSVPLLELMDLISGGTPKTSEPSYWDGEIPWASAKDVSQCGKAFLTTTERSITEEGLKKSSTKIIPKYSTVVVARGATTGRACMLGSDIAMNQTCYALKSKRNEPFFANCLFMHQVLNITQAAHGSVFDTITTKTLQAAEAVAPTTELSQAFENRVSPLFQLVLSRTVENERLAALRDTLLPRLMAGELRIRDAEKQVEEVI